MIAPEPSPATRAIAHVLLFIIRFSVPFFVTAVLLLIFPPAALILPAVWLMRRSGRRAQTHHR